MKLSIITPSFNQGRFIERTIQSVILQSAKLEFVIIDGGSEDQTLSILEKYSDKLKFISEKDDGQSHAINKGIAMTDGDIIGWLNSDDIYYPNALTRIANFFSEHPDIDIVYGDAKLIDQNDQEIGFYPTEAWNIKRLKQHCFISQPATFFRRSLIEKLGPLSQSLQYCMDYEFWLRAALAGATFAHLSHVVAGARVYGETKSSRYCLEASNEVMNLIQQKLGYIPAERLVSHAGALTKSQSKLVYPKVKFILGVWMNLWHTSGIYYHGHKRISAWLTSQAVMLREFLRRSIDTRVKKFIHDTQK